GADLARVRQRSAVDDEVRATAHAADRPGVGERGGDTELAAELDALIRPDVTGHGRAADGDHGEGRRAGARKVEDGVADRDRVARRRARALVEGLVVVRR